jgi:hypothetical protein
VALDGTPSLVNVIAKSKIAPSTTAFQCVGIAEERMIITISDTPVIGVSKLRGVSEARFYCLWNKNPVPVEGRSSSTYDLLPEFDVRYSDCLNKVLAEVMALILLMAAVASPSGDISRIFSAVEGKDGQSLPHCLEVFLVCCESLRPAQTMYILQHFSPNKVLWRDIIHQNIDEVIEARVKEVVEEIVLELPPEVLNVHRCAEARNPGTR